MTTTVRASRREYHIIYKTTCLVTGKWYIGMHSTDDLNDGYLGSGQQLRRSVKKYGKEQHKTEVLEFLPDRESLWRREEELVTKKLMEDELCMNLATGGQGKADRPLITPEEVSRKISQKALAMWDKRRAEGYVAPPQTKASIAKRVAKNTGKKRSEEQLANLHAGQAMYYTSADPLTLKERGQKGGASRAKTWRVVAPDSSEHLVKNLNSFAKERGASPSALYNAAARGVPVKGWLVTLQP